MWQASHKSMMRLNPIRKHAYLISTIVWLLVCAKYSIHVSSFFQYVPAGGQSRRRHGDGRTRNPVTVSRHLPMAVFTEDADTIFRRLTGGNSDLLAVEQLTTVWEELRQLMDEGDLTVDEVMGLCPESQVLTRLDFVALHEKIESMFDEEENEMEVGYDNDTDEARVNDAGVLETMSVKDIVLTYINDLRSNSSVRLPCGFDCDNRERELIQKGIDAMQQEPDNRLFRNGGRLTSSDVMGNWNLLYTSSRTMIINKSLSGLGRSTSDKAILKGIEMRLTGNKFLGQVEFVETFGSSVDDDDKVTLDVSVVGEWILEDGRNIFTGAPSSSLRVDPETITYGVSKNKADEWASLGPIKLLDFLYCDADLMILRGTANTDAHFIYQRHTTK
jgi:hypothetical protein